MTDQATTGQNGAGVRPTLLTVMCIISWVFQGIAAILLILAMVAGGAMGAGGGAVMLFGIPLALVALSFVGVLMMWKLKKVGFFLYVGAWLITVILPIAMGVGFVFSWEMIVQVALIVLFGVNLKAMK